MGAPHQGYLDPYMEYLCDETMLPGPSCWIDDKQGKRYASHTAWHHWLWRQELDINTLEDCQVNTILELLAELPKIANKFVERAKTDRKRDDAKRVQITPLFVPEADQ